MPLQLRAAPTPSDSAFARVLDAIPKGDQWKRGNVIPYSTYGGIPLLLDATPGTLVEIYVDGNVILRVDPQAPTTPITLELNKGYNLVVVKQGLSTFQTLLVTTEYAIFLRAFADEVYASVERDIIEFEQHLASFFSTRITEHQLEFSDLLPPQFAYRTLLSKLAVRAVINESSSTRGVDDILAAVTTSTPLAVPEIATTDPNPPNPMYSGADDFGGWKFHYWLPNTCAASWFGFVRLVDTLSDNETLSLVSANDHAVVVAHDGKQYTHYFDTEAAACNSLEDACAHDVYLAVRITSEVPVWMCLWGHEFDVGIELPLGRGRLDSTTSFDVGVPLDDVDPTAPADGWVGTILTKLDSGCLDTSVGGASGTDVSALDCCPAPVVVPLTESIVDVVAGTTTRMWARMTVLPA